MQTKNETDQDVDYTQSGGGGGGGSMHVECDETKQGNIERRGGMSGHFFPRCESPWVVEFTNQDGSKSAQSGPITQYDSLVTLLHDWTVSVTTQEELLKAS